MSKSIYNNYVRQENPFKRLDWNANAYIKKKNSDAIPVQIHYRDKSRDWHHCGATSQRDVTAVYIASCRISYYLKWHLANLY